MLKNSCSLELGLASEEKYVINLCLILEHNLSR